MKKKIFALLLALAMVFALAACGSQAAPASSGNLVGVSMPTKDLQRWNQDGENLKNMLEAKGYAVDLQFGANDIATQVSQLENMIANGAKVLVISAIDGDSLGTVLAQAKENGVYVIAYDRLIMNSDAVSYYATFDNFLVGVKQGEAIRDALDLDNAEGPFNIEFITGDPGDNNIHFFFGGGMSVLQPYIDSGKLVCQSGQTEEMDVATEAWSTEKAQARFENILGTYYSDGTQLDAVLASNDSTALGVENALENSYTGKYPIVTGQDCDIAIMKNLIEGKQAMSVFKDTRTLAAKVVEMVDALMKGTEPPVNDTETYDNGTGIIPSFLCEPVACTVDNYKELLIDSGYYTLEQLGVEDGGEVAAAPAAPAGELIKVGVVNNPPSESGYREANVNDFQNVFTEENGYDASFFYNIKNDEQLSAARQFITDGVDYLLISAAETTGWDAVLKDAQDQGIKVFLFDRMIDCDPSLFEAAVVSDMPSEGDTAVNWLLAQNLPEYNVIHIQGAMGSDAQIGRTGALDAQFEAGTMKKVAQQTATWDEAEAKKIVESVINSGEDFNVIYAENDGMAKGAVAALDEAGITHGVDGKVVVMGFDCNKWALRELLAGNWNYDGQCSPFQAQVISDMIKTLESGGSIQGLNDMKQIISVEKGFDAKEITQEDIDTYGLGE